MVKVTCAEDAPERASQAFTVAASAAAAGAQVSLWLTGEASWWAVPGRGADLGLEHATPVEDLLGVVLATGTVTLCTQCAARRGIGEADVREDGKASEERYVSGDMEEELVESGLAEREGVELVGVAEREGEKAVRRRRREVVVLRMGVKEGEEKRFWRGAIFAN